MSDQLPEQPRTQFLGFTRSKGGAGGGNYLESLAHSIGLGKVVPIISNSIRSDRFMAMFGFPDGDLGQFIAEIWAADTENEFGGEYPMKERQDLARLAQYRQVMNEGSPDDAKRDFLGFLTRMLLGWAKANDKAAAAKILQENLEDDPNLTFSDLVSKLGYPHYEPNQVDPLRLLAKLDLPVYITTSYYDFLERFLRDEGKDVHSEVYAWSGQLAKIEEQYLPDPNSEYEPTAKAPLVFHLFGMERFPHTMVLSVDDYLNFLVKTFKNEAEAKSSSDVGKRAAIPTHLWGKIAELPLLLLGYDLHDWEFQTVYRGLVTAKQAVNPDAGVVIQLKPNERRGASDPKRVEEYLKNYFDKEIKFRVEYDKPDEFMRRLYEQYLNRS